LKFHHFSENCNTQSLLHKMNDDKDKRQRSRQLIDAIDKNDTATASSLISSDVVNLNGKPWPLHRAAQRGRVEIMTMLLDAGADINAVDNDGHVACRVACRSNQFDALKLLVERGANLAVDYSNGLSILTGVAQHVKDERFVLLLLDAGAPLDVLSNGELMGLVKTVAVFNRLRARDVNFTTMRDESGRTLCHHVARSVTREDDLRLLVNACGNDAIHTVDNNGKTPLHSAASSSNGLAVRVLVEFGADIDRQNKVGWTALIEACSQARCSPVELIVALGADVNLVDRWGKTACHVVTVNRRTPSSLLCSLVAAGGNLDQPDNKGETLRMIATRENVALPTAVEVARARRRIAKTRLDLVRERAFQICLGLQPLNINALQLCEIMMHSFGAIGSVIAFHQWWAIATKVKHFRDHKQQSSATTTTTNKQRDKDPMKK
jgi:ankyrin repeat protein